MNEIFLNHSSTRVASRVIYFIIDLRELKITNIFKDTEYLKSLEPNYYLLCYRCPIYRGNLVYVGDNYSISFKSLANQILENSKRIAKEHECAEWIPNYGIIRGLYPKSYI